jgi:lysophospholipid acyltransferase (LPLAT)-like uncharacterized protein
VSDLKFEAAGVLGAGMVGALFTTTRLRREGQEHYLSRRRHGHPVVFVFWHGQLLPLVHYHRREGVVVLVSEHADGEYITRVIERQGFGTARGSSSRGAAKGLKALIRAARDGKDLALTPDGPQGPPRVFKPGALLAAQVTGLPVVPIGVGASGSWRLRSWDGFLVPRPFSRIGVVYGEARVIPRGVDREQLDGVAQAIGEELDALTARAEELAGR